MITFNNILSMAYNKKTLITHIENSAAQRHFMVPKMLTVHRVSGYCMFLSACLLAFTVFFSPPSLASAGDKQNHGFTDVQRSPEQWWNIPYPSRFEASGLRAQALLKTQNNKVVNSDGAIVTLRGVNIADMVKLTHEQQWSSALFDEVKAWGANVIRIPIHPLAWRQKGKAWFFNHLDEAVRWANQRDLYLILDWHSIGNLKSQMYQHIMYETSMVETANFWRDIAYRYKGVNTIAVYEVFNEPTHDFIGTGAGSLGKITWDEWRELLETLVDIIQVYDPETISLVSGFNWAYDLSEVIEKPIRRDNIAYAIHPYPQKAKVTEESIKNFTSTWQKQWGYIADTYPLMATELGWVNKAGKGAHIPVIHNGNTYGPAIVAFMKARDISWTAWAFDPDWAPVMIKDWHFTPTPQGEFFKEVLLNP